MSLLARAANLVVNRRWRDDPGPLDLNKIQKILVVRKDNIGDVICTTPALDALRAAFPRARIAALVCTLAAEALEGHRALDELYVYPKAKHGHYGIWESHRRLAAALARIRKERFDLALCFRAAFSSSQAWLAFASGARWRMGPRPGGKRAAWGFYYNLPVEPPPVGLHEVERCFHLLEAAGLDTAPERLYLKVPDEAKAKAAQFLEEHGFAGRRPWVLNIARWSYRSDKLWPEENYRRLASELAVQPEGLVVAHAPAESDWVEGVLGETGRDIPRFFSPSLKEFAAMIAAGRGFITAEGGPMHLAAAVGAPQVVLWSKSSLETWRPWRSQVVILQGGDDLAGLTPERALAALEELRGMEPAAPA